MNMQGDLFADSVPNAGALPEGMSLWPDFVTPVEEAELAHRIDDAPLAPFRFHQWQGKRLTAYYGYSYDFGRGRLSEAPPLPDWLLHLAKRAANNAAAKDESFVQALLIRYDPGAGIGWHRDRPQFRAVLGLSLTSEAVLRMRRRVGSRFERRAITLPPRSLYRLDGPARWEWEHSMLPVTSTRRSITLRSLREKRPQLS